jgi:hypothetical protein
MIPWRCNDIHVILNLVLSAVAGAVKNLFHESTAHAHPVKKTVSAF